MIRQLALIALQLRPAYQAGEVSEGRDSPGADIFVGFRKRTPSCQWYSKRDPALMTGHS